MDKRSRKISVNEIRAKLLEKNMTLKRFARINNFEYETLQTVIRRYYKNNNLNWTPSGPKTIKIIDTINELMEVNLKETF
ncbi:MAG: hypothetical protein GY795_44725 [Desulfobacterales bacterium]|nr:hypothetical protein [Desulfobacterales bacterium]